MTNIAIIGLGLIGGSFSKAFFALEDTSVFGFDSDEGTIRHALLIRAMDGRLDDEILADCDYVFVCLYPEAAEKYIEEKAHKFKKGSVVIDCCGTKMRICPTGFALAKEHGFNYIGGHPMAGRQQSGLKYSRSDMFKNANMILVPKKDESLMLLERVKSLLTSIGFGGITITTAENHDKIIAYTSQLAHVVSNAYVKSPSADVHKGFSAGSYKDLTRVARLNPQMWAELFFENKENITFEIKNIIVELQKYADALENNDFEKLCALLKEGSDRKLELDEK